MATNDVFVTRVHCIMPVSTVEKQIAGKVVKHTWVMLDTGNIVVIQIILQQYIVMSRRANTMAMHCNSVLYWLV